MSRPKPSPKRKRAREVMSAAETSQEQSDSPAAGDRKYHECFSSASLPQLKIRRQDSTDEDYLPIAPLAPEAPLPKRPKRSRSRTISCVDDDFVPGGCAASHPALAEMLMLECSGVQFRRVERH